MLCRITSTMFHAGSWRAVSFSTLTRRKQFCSGLVLSRKKADTTAGIYIAEIKVAFSSTVKLLGVTLDTDLSLNRHVTDIVRGCSYHTRALRHSRPLSNLSIARMVAQRVVTSQLDYCNGLLYTSARNMEPLERLQVAQNSLARVICQATWSASSTKLRRSEDHFTGCP